MTHRELARVVLPLGGDPDVLPLYVDAGRATTAPEVLGRRSLRVPAGERVSFATWFNAFPASYWRRWTTLTHVDLVVRLAGPGTVAVYRSTSSGSTARVALRSHDEGPADVHVRLPLDRFADGGWYWFDVAAGEAAVVVHDAAWTGEVPGEPGTATVAITTFNQPGYLLDTLAELAGAPDTLAVLDEVLVVDQGTDRLRAQPGFADAQAALGARLRVVEQANLGGSGGFARGMADVLEAGRSAYVLLLDDDVSIEPESVLRAVTFADACRTPTLVGGHMLSLYARSTLHSMGEVVRPWRFWWGPADHVQPGHDLARQGLRDTAWMHRRTDVDYNGWWMCLVPVEVVRATGLSLPLFIKWDDAEYGLRAREAGYPTVSLPGAAVWHVPWTEKDDALDWQAYFHQRNRLVAALLHSPYSHGGRLVRESLLNQARHLLALQYSVAELRLRAVEDLLLGPDHLHATLRTVLGEVRSLRAGHPDAVVSRDPAAYPDVARARPRKRDRPVEAPGGPLGTLARMLTGSLRQLRPVAPGALARPQAVVPSLDARWWRLAGLDSALVSTSDGTGAAWYRRDRRTAAALARRSAVLHARLLREWPALAQQYQAAAVELASPVTWKQTFEEGAP